MPGRCARCLAKMGQFAQKLMQRQRIGSPKGEGYIPRGLIRDQFVEKAAGERLVEMALAKFTAEAVRIAK